MKKVIFSIIVLGTALALFNLFASDNEPDNATTAVLLLYDQTPNKKQPLDPKSVISLFDFESDKWQGAIIRIVPLTDLSLNPIEQFSIQPARPLTSNAFDRQSKIDSFLARIETVIKQANQDTTGRSRSELYVPITGQLNWLSAQSAGKKTVIIFSDLMENNDWFSVLRENDLKMLTDSSAQIKKLFLKRTRPKDLSGIEIYLIHRSRTTDEDKLFLRMSGIYQGIFEERNANITVGANAIF